MPSHSQLLQSPYTAEQLFTLVKDVERYPEFLPWCAAVRILTQNESGFDAEMVVRFKGITQHYVSEVRLTPSQKIEVSQKSGPFVHLMNRWEFTPTAAGGCEVKLEIDFKFKSAMLEKMIGGLFGRATEKMTAAFEARAEELYSPPTQ